MQEAVIINLASSEDVISSLRTNELANSELAGVWVKDEDSFHSLDPKSLELIVEVGVALLPALFYLLRKISSLKKTTITITGNKNASGSVSQITIEEYMTEEEAQEKYKQYEDFFQKKNK